MSRLTRAASLASLGYVRARDRLLSRPVVSEISEDLLFGGMPLWENIEDLVFKRGVSAILSLNEDHELVSGPSKRDWAGIGVERLNIPIVDFTGVPTVQQIQDALTFIQWNLDQNRRVYVHCKAGRTRSASMIACYLVQHWAMAPEEAMRFVRHKRGHVLFTPQSVQSITEYHRLLQQGEIEQSTDDQEPSSPISSTDIETDISAEYVIIGNSDIQNCTN